MALVTTSKDKFAVSLAGRTSAILAHPRYTLTPNLQHPASSSAGAAPSSAVFSSCDISPDGRFLAAASLDCKIFLWVRTPSSKPATSSASAAASSASRRHFVCVASYSFRAPATRVRFAGPNSNLLVASLASGHVAVVDIEAGKVERMLRPPPPQKIVFENAVVLNDVAVAPPQVSPECKCIASAGDDGRVTVFDLRISSGSAKCFQTPVPQTAVAFAATVAPEVTAADAGSSASNIAAGSGGIGIFCGGVDGSLRWLQLNSKGEMRCAVECLDAHDDAISGLDTNANCATGVVLSYSSFAGSVRVHDLRPWSRDNRHVLFEDDSLLLDSNKKRSIVVDRSLLRCAFSPNGTSLAVGTPVGAVAVYENWQEQQRQRQQQQQRKPGASSNTNNARFYVSPHAAPVTDVKFHPECDQHGEVVLITSSVDGSCVVACA